MSLIPNKKDAIFHQRNDANTAYQAVVISGSDAFIYLDSSGNLTAEKFSSSSQFFQTSSYSYTSSNIAFNGNRNIKRNPYEILDMQSFDVVTFLERFFFPYISASITINDQISYYETGSSQTISLLGSILPHDETFIDTGSIWKNGIEWYTFPSQSDYFTSDSGITSDTEYQTRLNTGGEIITSSVKDIVFIYPYLFGVSDNAGLTGSALYSQLNKEVSIRDNKKIPYNGLGKYVYFCYPTEYGNLSLIRDPNLLQFNESFEFSSSVPVTSSGLYSDWSTLYNVYRLKFPAEPNGYFYFYTGSGEIIERINEDGQTRITEDDINIIIIE